MSLMTFSPEKSKRMPVHKPYDHGIDFVKDASLPKLAKLYPLSSKECNSLDEWIEERLRQGYITESKSLLAAPVFFVKKNEDGLHLCMDYRKLNDITIKKQLSYSSDSKLG